MSERGVPPPPRQPRSVIVTALLLIGGILLLAPGVCAVIFIREYMSSPQPAPSSFVLLWIVSFVISALGIAQIIYAFRRYRT
jgi:hypothetical protein